MGLSWRYTTPHSCERATPNMKRYAARVYIHIRRVHLREYHALIEYFRYLHIHADISQYIQIHIYTTRCGTHRYKFSYTLVLLGDTRHHIRETPYSEYETICSMCLHTYLARAPKNVPCFDWIFQTLAHICRHITVYTTTYIYNDMWDTPVYVRNIHPHGCDYALYPHVTMYDTSSHKTITCTCTYVLCQCSVYEHRRTCSNSVVQ